MQRKTRKISNEEKKSNIDLLAKQNIELEHSNDESTSQDRIKKNKSKRKYGHSSEEKIENETKNKKIKSNHSLDNDNYSKNKKMTTDQESNTNIQLGFIGKCIKENGEISYIFSSLSNIRAGIEYEIMYRKKGDTQYKTKKEVDQENIDYRILDRYFLENDTKNYIQIWSFSAYKSRKFNGNFPDHILSQHKIEMYLESLEEEKKLTRSKKVNSNNEKLKSKHFNKVNKSSTDISFTNESSIDKSFRENTNSKKIKYNITEQDLISQKKPFKLHKKKHNYHEMTETNDASRIENEVIICGSSSKFDNSDIVEFNLNDFKSVTQLNKPSNSLNTDQDMQDNDNLAPMVEQSNIYQTINIPTSLSEKNCTINQDADDCNYSDEDVVSTDEKPPSVPMTEENSSKNPYPDDNAFSITTSNSNLTSLAHEEKKSNKESENLGNIHLENESVSSENLFNDDLDLNIPLYEEQSCSTPESQINLTSSNVEKNNSSPKNPASQDNIENVLINNSLFRPANEVPLSASTSSNNFQELQNSPQENSINYFSELLKNKFLEEKNLESEILLYGNLLMKSEQEVECLDKEYIKLQQSQDMQIELEKCKEQLIQSYNVVEDCHNKMHACIAKILSCQNEIKHYKNLLNNAIQEQQSNINFSLSSK